MKKLIIIAMSVILTAGPLMAQSLEQLRKSSENMSIDTGSLRAKAATDQYEITPTPVLVKLIVNFFKLLFGQNGDIEIANPSTDRPQVDGTLEDDQSEEQYSEGNNYKPIDPADLQEPQSAQQPQQPQQSPEYQQPQQTGSGATANGSVPEDLMRKALAYYSANAAKIQNKKYIGIVDFSAHSSKQRFFIVDMQSGAVHAIHVAHGKGSDPDGDGYATRFSNTPESKASSLGFYLTGPMYYGSHGKSMRLLGQSPTNSNALARAVVIHESAYVREANVIQGRSFGCLAVATTEIRQVLASLNGGALIYAGLSNSDF